MNMLTSRLANLDNSKYDGEQWRLPIMAEEVENNFAKVVIVFPDLNLLQTRSK